jgi:hypothetical protein
MKKLTILVLFLFASCLIWATTHNVSTASALQELIDGDGSGDAVSGDVINLAAATYLPPEVTLPYRNFFTVGAVASDIDMTVNAFTVKVADITINGDSESGVIIDTPSSSNYEIGFLVIADNVVIQNLTIQNVNYGVMNHLGFNLRVNDTAVVGSGININHITFNGLDSGIILTPGMRAAGYVVSGSWADFFGQSAGYIQGDDNLFEGFERWFFDRAAGCPSSSTSRGFQTETSNPIEYCTFNDMTNMFCLYLFGYDTDLLHNTFNNIDLGFNLKPGASDASYDNTVNDFELAYNTVNGLNQFETGYYTYDESFTYASDAYYICRSNFIYIEPESEGWNSGTYHNNTYSNIGNGAIDRSQINDKSVYNDTYNYIGNTVSVISLGWVKGQQIFQDCFFYSFGSGSAFSIKGMGDLCGTGSNPDDSENYSYTNTTNAHANERVEIINCTFVHTSAPDSPGVGEAAGIFCTDLGLRTSPEPGNYGEVYVLVEDCSFDGYAKGVEVNAGRPDNMTSDNVGGTWSGVLNHDDGRLQVLVTGTSFTNCAKTIDCSVWDQWVETASWVIAENCYFGTSGDPYGTFGKATDFPDGITHTYIEGNSNTNGNYHVYQTPIFQYAPYYTDIDMTQLAVPVPADLALSRSGTDFTLTWTDNANPDVNYKVYQSDDPNSGWIFYSDATNSETITSTGVSEYFAVATEIPNLGDGTFSGSTDIGYEPTYNLSVIYNDDTSYDLEKAGFKKFSLTTNGTNFNFISLPFNGDYATMANMATYLGLNTDDSFSEWDEETQGWITASYGGSVWEENIDPMVSNSYYISKGTTTSDVYILGTLPEPASFDLITTEETNMNFIMIPLDQNTITNLEDLGNSIGTDNVSTVSVWDAATQAWKSATYLEFLESWVGYTTTTINIGDPVMVGAKTEITWPD